MSADKTPKPDRPPEQIAVGYIQDAEAFRVAALLVQPQDSRPTEAELGAPAWHLLCHSAELALKAFLLSNGYEPNDLKTYALRHNLLGLYEAAVERGFLAPDDEFRHLMEWLGPYHGAHDFRYRRPGAATLAAPWFIAEVFAPVIADIARTVRSRWQATQSPQKAKEALAVVGLSLAEPSPE